VLTVIAWPLVAMMSLMLATAEDGEMKGFECVFGMKGKPMEVDDLRLEVGL